MTVLTEMEMDELVTAEADDTGVWEPAVSAKGLAEQLNLPLGWEERLESVVRHRQWQAGLEQEAFFDQVFGAVPAS